MPDPFEPAALEPSPAFTIADTPPPISPELKQAMLTSLPSFVLPKLQPSLIRPFLRGAWLAESDGQDAADPDTPLELLHQAVQQTLADYPDLAEQAAERLARIPLELGGRWHAQVTKLAGQLTGLGEADQQQALEPYSREQQALLQAQYDAVSAELAEALRPHFVERLARLRARRTNRKVKLPWAQGSLFPIPNIQNHGVRNLARIMARDALWQPDPSGGQGEVAVLDGKAIGRIDFTPRQEGAERTLLDLLGPRAIKTMVVVSRLIIEGTNRSPLNHATTLRVGEIARAMGYKPDKHRAIDPGILRRIAGDVYMLSKVETWAADGPYDPKTKHRPSGWVAPLIAITAVHVAQTTMQGAPLPFEFDAMLGRNWAQALLDCDLLQIAPGLMEIHDENVIRLAWYYLTEFRYRMTKRSPGAARKIAALCDEARISAGQPKDRGRFLARLEQWHAQLADKAVIGVHSRTPPSCDVEHDNAWTPSRIFAEGEYHVEPPAAILAAYQQARQRALQAAPNGKRGARARA